MEKIMVPIEAISRFRWDADCGVRLKELRGKKSRAILAKEIASSLEIPEAIGKMKPESCSARYIQKLEEGDMNSIPTEMLAAIVRVLGTTTGEILMIAIWASN
jgi:transcriptional regulator with XRE-family HTH domain